jgi:hypothetical protein
MQHQRINQIRTTETIHQRSPATSITPPSPASAPVHPILQLQQTIGNKAVQRLLWSRTIQAKLSISHPSDIYEQEADRVAEHVMRMPEPTIQRACAPCSAGGAPCPKCEAEKKSLVQRKTEGVSESSDSVPDDFVKSLGPGRPLTSATRAFFEPRFGRDFSDVRVYADGHAAETTRSINAKAFTVGRAIAFGAGHYAPDSREGRELLAHELTHVVQQDGGAETVPQTHRPGGVLQRKSGGAARGTYPFSVTTSGCDKAPFNKATVEDAAKKAFEQVRDTDCVKTASLREDILAEFSGLSIECKQGVSKTNKNRCAEAPGETSDVSLYRTAVELNCGPLEGVVLHEVVHLLERAFFGGHGDLTYACQESCFPGASRGRGDPSRCTFEKGLMPVVGASGGVGFSREGSPAWVARFYFGFEKRVVGVVHPSLGFGYALIGESTSGKPGGIPSSTTSLTSVLLGLRVDPGLPGGGYLSLSGGPAVAIGNKTAAIGAEVGVAFGFRWRVLDISLDAGISYDPTRETGMETNYTLGATIRFGRSVPRR